MCKLTVRNAFTFIIFFKYIFTYLTTVCLCSMPVFFELIRLEWEGEGGGAEVNIFLTLPIHLCWEREQWPLEGGGGDNKQVCRGYRGGGWGVFCKVT